MMIYINHSTYDEKNEILIERVLPGISSKISNQTRTINSLEKVTSSLGKVIMNSDNDSNNNFNNIKNSIRVFCEHIRKFPEINNNEKQLIIIDTLQNNGNDMITQQIETPNMKVILNNSYLLIPNKFEKFGSNIIILEYK